VTAMVAAAWRQDAACAGLAPAFDAESWTAEAVYAARVCWRCPAADACERDAARSGASGVRAGRVWRAGIPVDVLEPLPRAGVASCGTASGYERHRRRGEEPCEGCAVARTGHNARHHRRRRGPGRPPAVESAESLRLVERMVAVGWTNRRIADELGTSERTVTGIRARLRAQNGEAA
jgi:hypothetical protein